MELPLFTLFLILLALLLSLLNGIVTEVQEVVVDKVPKKYFRIYDEKSIVSASFLFFELLFYFIAIQLIALYTVFLSLFWGDLFKIIPLILMITVFILRVTLHSVGGKFANKLFLSFYKLIGILYKLFRFSGVFYFWYKRRILNTEGEATIEDIQEVVESAHEEGTIQTGEYKIFTNVIKFNQVPVADVMTPRTVIFSCNANMTVEEAIKQPEIKIYSRFPIYEGNSLDDKVVGYVMSKDVFQAALNNKMSSKLKEFARDIFFIPENVSLDDALNQFLSKRQHIFLVVDEFGGIEGLLTMEDLIETILGEEIIDEADKYIDLREVAKNKRQNRLKLIQSSQNTIQQNLQ